jgi:hypothetical protein
MFLLYLINLLLIFQALLEFPAAALSWLSSWFRRVPPKLTGNSPGDVSSRMIAMQVVVERVPFDFI